MNNNLINAVKNISAEGKKVYYESDNTLDNTIRVQMAYDSMLDMFDTLEDTLIYEYIRNDVWKYLYDALYQMKEKRYTELVLPIVY